MLECVLDGAPHQPLGAEGADGLDAEPAAFTDLDLHFVLQEGRELLRLGAAGLPLDAGVDVLDVLAKDHHVKFLRFLHR